VNCAFDYNARAGGRFLGRWGCHADGNGYRQSANNKQTGDGEAPRSCLRPGGISVRAGFGSTDLLKLEVNRKTELMKLYCRHQKEAAKDETRE
jgi:hypothetical protein